MLPHSPHLWNAIATLADYKGSCSFSKSLLILYVFIPHSVEAIRSHRAELQAASYSHHCIVKRGSQEHLSPFNMLLILSSEHAADDLCSRNQLH